MRIAALASAIGGVTAAQSLIEAERLAEVRQAFASPEPATPLRCSFEPERPKLHYDLQFHTGYSIVIPLSRTAGSEHELTVLLRVTPDGRDPVYLSRTDALPNLPPMKFEGELAGEFVLGEGAYAVDAIVRNGSGPLCSGKWRLQVKRPGGERELPPATPPSYVRENSDRGPAAPMRGGPAIERLTILLHAAAAHPRAAKLEESTVRMLEDSLASLNRRLSAQSVRLVVFNADQHNVLLRKNGFTAADLPQVSSVLERVELARVDYRTLQNRDKGDLLSDLVEKELRDPRPASAVIFLGPRAPSILDPAFQPDPQIVARLRWFYLEYENLVRAADQPFGRRGYGRGTAGPDDPRMGGGGGRGRRGIGADPTAPSDPPNYIERADGIEQLLRRIRGETIPVRTPREFAEAIVRMRSQIPAANRAPEPAASSR